MKTIDKFITEKLNLSKAKIPSQYTCKPKNQIELRYILEERLAKDKNADLNDIDVSGIPDMGAFGGHGLFEDLDPHNIDISGWDMSNAVDTGFMFLNCKNFTGQGLENWEVSKVQHMAYMFYGCEKFDTDLSEWKVSKVVDMSKMFHYCKSLKNKPSWYKE